VSHHITSHTGVESAVPGESVSSDTVDALCWTIDLISGLLRLILRTTSKPILVTDHRESFLLTLLRLTQPTPNTIILPRTPCHRTYRTVRFMLLVTSHYIYNSIYNSQRITVFLCINRGRPSARITDLKKAWCSTARRHSRFAITRFSSLNLCVNTSVRSPPRYNVRYTDKNF